MAASITFLGGFQLLALAVLLILIVQEERFLARAYGAAYEAYRARTARYVAWPNRVRSRQYEL